jgi:hypothetical protein
MREGVGGVRAGNGRDSVPGGGRGDYSRPPATRWLRPKLGARRRRAKAKCRLGADSEASATAGTRRPTEAKAPAGHRRAAVPTPGRGPALVCSGMRRGGAEAAGLGGARPDGGAPPASSPSPSGARRPSPSLHGAPAPRAPGVSPRLHPVARPARPPPAPPSRAADQALARAGAARRSGGRRRSGRPPRGPRWASGSGAGCRSSHPCEGADGENSPPAGPRKDGGAIVPRRPRGTFLCLHRIPRTT